MSAEIIITAIAVAGLLAVGFAQPAIRRLRHHWRQRAINKK